MGTSKGTCASAKRALCANNALRDGGFGNEKGACDLGCGETAEQTQREGDARFRREHGMAGDEDQTEQVVLNISIGCGGQRSCEVRKGALLLFLQLARELFVFPFQPRVVAQNVDSAVLGGSHEPCAGVLRDARLRPLLEGSDQSILGELFGDANIAHDSREAGDDARRLHAPYGVDGAIDLAAVDVSRSHGGSPDSMRASFAARTQTLGSAEPRTLGGIRTPLRCSVPAAWDIASSTRWLLRAMQHRGC